jgi:hypothetical protein
MAYSHGDEKALSDSHRADQTSISAELALGCTISPTPQSPPPTQKQFGTGLQPARLRRSEGEGKLLALGCTLPYDSSKISPNLQKISAPFLQESDLFFMKTH